MPRKLKDAVVVITGASSGIGEATALAMASEGATLSLSARGQDALERVSEDCRRRGARVLAVPTDVADEPSVAELARRTAEELGRIDVWVNNAGVILYGRLEDTPGDAYRRVIEVNLFGQINGAKAAVPYFRRQGAGVLINLSSVWGRVTSPYVGAYVTSKFGVRAFSECLRQELVDAHDIHVVTILPQAVDTPMWKRAANFSGRKVRALPLAKPPEEIAKRIVWCSEDPKREVTDRRAGRLLEFANAAAPKVWSRLVPRMFDRLGFDEGVSPDTPGNLFEPVHSDGAD
jgi:NAD(P)-dependent dehydrogenase (short-subunit alcohol dehydrogenase family)